MGYKTNRCADDIGKADRSKWTHGSTDRINRLRDQYWQYPPTIDPERAVSYTKTYKATEAEDTIIRRAKALYNYFSERTITINPDELIVGTYGRVPRSVLVCPEVSWMWYRDELDTMATRPQDPYQIAEEDKEILKEIFPYWEGKSMEEYFLAHTSGVVFGDNKSAAGAGEFAPGYGNIILKKGFKGIREEAEKCLAELDSCNIHLHDKRKFYEAAIICCDAVKLLADRHAEKAMELVKEETDKKRKAELIEIAAICNKVPYNPPETFQEAIQAVWFTQISLFTEENTTSFCIDRPDQYLYPFYQKDKSNGIITDEKAQEIFDCLWIKMAEIIYNISEGAAMIFSGYQPYHGLTIGGCTKDGEDASNELSYMALQASMNTRMHVPTVNVRVNEKTSDEFMMKVCELIEVGTGQPAIFFDETAWGILKNNGVHDKDLWNWCVAGCVEPQIPGKMTMWDEGGRFCYATAIEWALWNGVSKIVGPERIGLETGDPRNFKTYEELEEATAKQLDYLVKAACMACSVVERAHMLRIPKPLRSICVEGSMEKGLDIMQKGAIYNVGPGMESTGVADLADSLAAIKKLVYEEKRISMDQLLKALDKDFEGYEDIRQMLINAAPKYGNDDPYVDNIASKFVELSCDMCGKYTSLFGSKYVNGLVPVIANIPHGEVITALPSGRKATMPLADGISPFPGYDKHGPSSVIKSVCSIDHTKNGCGTLLNMKLSPSLIASKEDKRKLIALLRAEGKLGGYHIQFNVVKKETLVDALERPDEYKDLLVRVAGYSAYFVDLRREAQDSIIARTENAAW
jgi:pyruvate formate-lyase/glycerol dehydratase family glycyl radical enzyme